MSYAYTRSRGSSSLPSFTIYFKTQFQSFVNRILGRLTGVAQEWISDAVADFQTLRALGRSDIRSSTTLVFKRVFTVVNIIILLWVFTLRWGERTVFQEHIDSCFWDNWERWVRHLFFVVLIYFPLSLVIINLYLFLARRFFAPSCT